MPALVPFVWFEVLRNHSQIHAFFTFRSVAVSVGIVIVAALAPTTWPVSTDSASGADG